MSKSFSILATTLFNVKKKDVGRAKFTEVLSQTEIPLTIGNFMSHLYDQATTFAHQYISAVSISWFHEMVGTIELMIFLNKFIIYFHRT